MATEPGPDVAEALFQAHHASTPAPVFLAPSMVSPLPSVHVLIVCAGNVRRSPIAAALWRHKFREQPMWVQSAGLNALNGCGINPRAESVLTQHGLTGRPHIARQVTAALVEEASKDPAFLEQAAKVNKVIVYKGPEAFWRFQEEELKKYQPLATKMGIRK